MILSYSQVLSLLCCLFISVAIFVTWLTFKQKQNNYIATISFTIIGILSSLLSLLNEFLTVGKMLEFTD